MRRVLLLVICLIASSSAAASGQDDPEVQIHSVGGTVAMSIGGTALPIFVGAVLVPHTDDSRKLHDLLRGAMIVAGATIGPGLGHVYAHNFKRYPRGFGLRAFGAVLIIQGHMLKQPYKRPPESTALYFGGAALLIGGTLLDMVGAPMLVDRQIREGTMRENPRFELSASGLGLQLRVNF